MLCDVVGWRLPVVGRMHLASCVALLVVDGHSIHLLTPKVKHKMQRIKNFFHFLMKLRYQKIL